MAHIATAKCSAACRELDFLRTDFSEAQHQWQTYATHLGAGYSTAYEEHMRVLNYIRHRREVSNEVTFFIFSTLCAGFAGGLVGGLMAPWVGEAGNRTAREIAKGLAQEGAKKVPVRVVAELTRESGDALQPACSNPRKYRDNMMIEVGDCFSVLRADVDDLRNTADAQGWSAAIGASIRQAYGILPLLRDQPTQSDMPNETKVAREAEIAMWIAWAHVQDTKRWREWARIIDHVDRTAELIILMQLKNYDPILKELLRLGVPRSRVTYLYERDDINRTHPDHIGRVLHFEYLQKLGSYYPKHRFLNLIAAGVKNPRKQLSKLQSLQPIYKR